VNSTDRCLTVFWYTAKYEWPATFKGVICQYFQRMGFRNVEPKLSVLKMIFLI